jgi:exosortase
MTTDLKDSRAEAESAPPPIRGNSRKLDLTRSLQFTGIVLRTQWHFCLLIAVVGLLYGSVLKGLVLDWARDPDYGHGFIVPLFAGYALWHSSGRWRNLPHKSTYFGLAVILAAIALLIVGSLGAELFLSRISLLVLLAGIVLYLFGWKMLGAVAFPLGYLVLMVPLPSIIYNQVTFPLQLQASRLAADTLEAVQVPVLREGNLLILPNHTLEVVEACSGIRSLMSLIALVIAYGYLTERRLWVRIALAALIVPIAVLSNGFRVFGAGVSTYFLGPEWAEGFFHAFSGWLIFMTALIGMLLAHQALKRIAMLVKRGANG